MVTGEWYSGKETSVTDEKGGYFDNEQHGRGEWALASSRKYLMTSRDRISRGSEEEIIDDFNVCIDENYCSGLNFDQLKEDVYELMMRIYYH